MLIFMRTSISFIVNYTSLNKLKKPLFYYSGDHFKYWNEQNYEMVNFITRVLKDNKWNKFDCFF